MLVIEQPRARRREESSSSSGGGMGCFLFLLVAGAVIFFILRGRGDKRAVLGATKRPMGSGPVADHRFACPYPKCPNCAAPSDKMTSDWDGMRKVSWKCGYCTSVAGIQELKDEELPASARQRLGLDPPPGQGFQGQGHPQAQGGGFGAGDLLTGMMIGSMMGGMGGHRNSSNDGFSGGTDTSSTGTDWGESSTGSDWGSSDSGGGDSGGGDSGGGSDW
jgi:hypothetical protein